MSPQGWMMPPVFLQTGNPETENNVTLSYKGQLGMRFVIVNPQRGTATAAADTFRSKAYQIIRTDSTMTTNPYPGAVAWWSDRSQYLVTTSASKTGRGRIAGVFRNAITPGNYGCVQVEGPAPVKLIDSPTSTPTANSGQFIIPSSTDGKADCLAAGTASTYPTIGLVAGTLSNFDNTILTDLDIPVAT